MREIQSEAKTGKINITKEKSAVTNMGLQSKETKNKVWKKEKRMGKR